ncbi:winged helix-turn-helix transcriptional regulator [Methanoplanus sp. FWC-SCC4]|uniref:Winged helix-turn-helix transcriptional regulator n=1 Tax=Methanochimaera problematica TaxID=2609417 RepID=A0AA97FDZ6_9EURY|nr:winged helix-turn-helix transcriptional regulator [Methanoplanus sp. FWC-SCC4]WOF16283.1 winged helix-turn-helix transcriptional regulator [Methanoplanus sp. FWC-SCC4]
MAIYRKAAIVLIFFLAAMFLVLPASAQSVSYSVQGWDESPPVSEAKAPVPLDLWEVQPLAVIAVMLVLISPAFLLPAQIILAGAGLVTLNFRRIDKKTILENNFRNRIYRFIIHNPGTCFTDIENRLSVNRGTLDYHLRMLKQEHLITVFLKNNRSFYFENSGSYSDSEMKIFVSLRNETEFLICEYLSDSPDASRDDIAGMIQTSCSTVSWHMGRLCDAGVIFSTKCGRVVRYRLSPSALGVMNKINSKCIA